MATVRFSNVRKSYAATEVIHGVSAEIPDGAFVVLVGPSGCGKSTLLRMLAGLEGITGGEISIGDRVVNMLPPKSRDIAMVFQSYALYPHMTVADNMGFSLRLHGKSASEKQEKVRNAAQILGLEALLDRYPKELSGGQRQRVAMGRAIVRDPQIFLFDEPLSNLDASLRVQMRREIKELHQRLESTIVYVTHDQIEAMTMADMIVVMREGTVEQIGSPLDLYDKPVSRFVAGFIGSPAMNFLEGTLRHRNGTAGLETSDGQVLELGAPPALNDGAALLCGIRPEHFELDETDGPRSLRGDVVAVEPTGAETLLDCRVAGATLNALFRDRHAISPGAPIALRPHAEKMSFFDPSSGRRLEPVEA